MAITLSGGCYGVATPYLYFNVPASALTAGNVSGSQLGMWTQAATTDFDQASIMITPSKLALHSIVGKVYGAAATGTMTFALNVGTTVTFNGATTTPQINGPYTKTQYPMAQGNSAFYCQSASGSSWSQSSGGLFIQVYVWAGDL